MGLNTEFLMILIFAHLMADYVFQSSKIADNKAKSFRGIVIHEIIVLLVSTIILSIYGLIGFLVAAIISISHLAIDYTKMKTSKFFRFQTVSYLIDQMLHFGVIILCEYLFRSKVNEPIIKFEYAGLLNYILIITFMATVIVKVVLNDIYGDNSLTHNFFIKYERLYDCLIILIVALSFFNTLAGIITLVIAIAVFYFAEVKYFKYSKYQIIFKAALYLIIASAFRFLVNY